MIYFIMFDGGKTRYVTYAASADEAERQARKHWTYINGKNAPIPAIYCQVQAYENEVLVAINE